MSSGIAFASTKHRTQANFWQAFWARVTDVLFGASMVWQGMPETLFERVYLGALPLEFFLFYGALVSALLEVAVAGGGGRRWAGEHVAITAAVVLMAATGALQGAELRWWVIDASTASGLLLGLHWGNQRSVAAAVRFIGRCGLICTLVLLVTVIGLALGIIPPAADYRTFTYGLFSNANVAAIALPVLCVSARASSAPGRKPGWFGVACFGGGTALAAAVLSATRSGLIVSLVSILLTFWAMGGRSRIWAVSLAVLTGIAVAVVVDSQAGILSNGVLADRFRAKELHEEDRSVEVEMMFEDMSTQREWWLGKGFGSRFQSVVVVDGEDWAIAPHIGILTSWYKGGVLSFLIVVAYPTILGVYRVFAFRRSRVQLAWCAGFLVTVVIGTLSGGWSFLLLFMYGAFAALSGRQSGEFER